MAAGHQQQVAEFARRTGTAGSVSNVVCGGARLNMRLRRRTGEGGAAQQLSLIHISEPTRPY